jgi:drug/metabolite transporter (DMT)-like permease
MTKPEERRLLAALLITSGIGIASAQDAIVKSVAHSMPVYEALLIRGAVGAPILAVWLALTDGFKSFITPLFGRLVLRGFILSSAYIAFLLAIAAMPIANAVAIYFTMPFFVATLAGPFLGESVPVYRWLAMSSAFIGVLIMVRPGVGVFEPASLLALYSAFGYAVGQMMGRRYSQSVPPITMSNVQNAVYLVVAATMFFVFNGAGWELTGHKSLAFLSRPAVVPTLTEFLLLSLMGALAAVASVLFTFAYKFAQSNFVAPFEYTAMIWAVFYGLVLFGDFPDAMTWVGMAVVIAAGLWMMWRDGRYSTG